MPLEATQDRKYDSSVPQRQILNTVYQAHL